MRMRVYAYCYESAPNPATNVVTKGSGVVSYALTVAPTDAYVQTVGACRECCGGVQVVMTNFSFIGEKDFVRGDTHDCA